MPTRKKRTWTQKLHDAKDLPKVFRLTGRAREKWGDGMMVIPAPIEVDALMRRVPKGKLVTTNDIRDALARRHHASTACPITTGIFAWIAAHAAAESAGKDATPYWRTLKIRGEVNAKYPGGALAVCRKLRAEGHRIQKRGSRYFVADYEATLADLR